MYAFVRFIGTTSTGSRWPLERRCPMPERILPEWAARVGAEVRDRAEQLPINEPYLVEVTDLLRVISEEEDAQRRRDALSNPPAPN